MCGISGIFNFKNAEIPEERLTKMHQEIALRGPDDYDIWKDGGIGLTHRRLSIIDVSKNGHQPMFSEDKRFVIVFNGEIYNYKEFNTELVNKGYKLKSNSDTEVLLYLYMEYGEKMLHRLNGMFAFAIWDKHRQELFIARDRLGVKPFYYSFNADEFIFASEPKAIFAAGIKATLKESNINEWLLYRFIAGEETFFTNIKKLLPGHFMKLKADGRMHLQRWWHLGEQIANHSDIADPVSWFAETFQSSIRYRMVSDVPVGVLLSGGLDSSSVAASLKLNGYEGIHTFNVGFRNYENDESGIAGRLSQSLQFPYHTIYVEQQELRDALIQSTLNYDEPLVHLNDPQIYTISKLARSYVKVLLSGEGADEILGGYVRYKTAPLLNKYKIINALLKLTPEKYKPTRVKKMERYFQASSLNQLIISNSCNYFEYDFKLLGLPYLGISNQYRMQVLNEANTFFGNDITKKILYYDQHTYLQSLNDRNDRATMGASIECREPFQDYRLIEGIGHLSSRYVAKGKKGKVLLTESMKHILPDYILNFKKVGFGVPWKKLILESDALRAEFNAFITSDTFEQVGLGQSIGKRLTKAFMSNDADVYEHLTIQLFTFYIWKKYYLTKYC